VLAAAPKTLRIGMHLCRGNRAGQFHAEGGYDVVADKLFNALNIGFYFLEYDSPRAGDYAPLRFVPPSKSVILGLVSTKTTTVENRDELKARIEAATKFVALDRLCISPQCGFASVDIGNPISAQVQEDKLRLLVELAKDIWADA
jgi:5-methyltetrahydropteroyltriglutamate--homocysteine methyltransferase